MEKIKSPLRPKSISNPSSSVVNSRSNSGTSLGLEDFPILKGSSSTGATGIIPNSSNGGADKSNLDSTKLDDGGSNVSEIPTSASPVQVINGENSNPKEGKSLFPLPIAVTPQPCMKFIPPVEIDGKRVVDSHTHNFSEGIKSCEDLVVGYFVGKRLSFYAVQTAVTKLWKLKKEVSIKLFGECAFIFEFADEEDRKHALETGSFLISNNLFTLRPWTHLIEKSIADIKSVPIWVLIYGVPLHMWNSDGLSLIASYLGIPLLADECTIKKTRLSYARICVEVDIDFAYPESIPLVIDGKITFDLPVEYQWRPPKCDTCMVFGHNTKSCSRKLKTRWMNKKIRKIFPESSTRNVESAPVSHNSGGGDSFGFVGEENTEVVIHKEATVEINAQNHAHEASNLAKESIDSGSTENSLNAKVLNKLSGISSNISTNKGGLVKDKPVDTNKTRVIEKAGSSEEIASASLQGDTETVKGKTLPNKGVNALTCPKKTPKPATTMVNGILGPNSVLGQEENTVSTIVSSAENPNAAVGSKEKTMQKERVNKSVGVSTVPPFQIAPDKQTSPTSNQTVLSKIGNSKESLTSSDSSQEVWVAAKGKSTSKRGVSQASSPKNTLSYPKKNPFLMLSDFREDSRFPIDSRKLEARIMEASAPSKVVNEDKVIIEEVEDDSEDLDDSEFETNLNYLSYEEKISKRNERDSKRKDRELNRLKWNGSNGISEPDKQEHLGRGYRTQTKKGHS